MSKGIMITAAGELAEGRPYAERSEREAPLHDKAAEFLLGCTVRPLRQALFNSARALASIVALVEQHDPIFAAASDQELASRARAMRGVCVNQDFPSRWLLSALRWCVRSPRVRWVSGTISRS